MAIVNSEKKRTSWLFHCIYSDLPSTIFLLANLSKTKILWQISRVMTFFNIQFFTNFLLASTDHVTDKSLVLY